jgi:hypothetical protein
VKLLGDWLVWERDGVTRSLDTGDICYAAFTPDRSQAEALVLVSIYGQKGAVPMHGDDAVWFWDWWMKRLEQRLREEEETAARCAEILAHRTTPPQDT